MVIGRTTQMSPETAHGSVPTGGATKQLTDLIIPFDPNFGVQEIRGIGRRFISSVAPNGQEYTGGKVGGGMGYNSFVYLLSMILGASNPAPTLVTGGTDAYQWHWNVPLSGSIDPVSMDIEQGDSIDAERILWAILQDIGFDATRQSVSPSATLMARAIEKAVAGGTGFTGMTTSNVVTVPISSVLPDDWSVFMSSTWSALVAGGTRLTRCFHAKFDYGGAYLPFFPLDSTLKSYGGTADGEAVKATFLIELMKDAVGEGLWEEARDGLAKFVRFLAGGLGASPLIDNKMTLTKGGAPTGGHFHVVYRGVPTDAITYSTGHPTAAEVQTALTAHTLIGANNVTCSGGPLDTAPVICTFAGPMKQRQADVAAITCDSTGLTPSGTITPSFVQNPFSIQVDMAGKVIQPGGSKDTEGLRTREWTFDIVEDGGHALEITVVNSLSQL